MIEHLYIKNFQSHDDTEMEFHPGVNVIIGLSDTGKSAIIRALNWVIKNRPSGDSFRSKWGGTTAVEIVTERGNVARVRTKSENKYSITYDNDGSELKALRQDIPEEVRSLLEMDELNIQNQIDPHFIFSSTPGAVATQLNEVTGLYKIDVGMKSLKSSLDSLNRKEKSKQEELERLNEEYKELAPVIPEMEADLTVAENFHRECKNKYSNMMSLSAYLSEIDRIDEELKDVDYFDDMKKDLLNMESLIEEINRKGLSIKTLSKYVYRYEELEESIGEDQEFLKAKKKTFEELMPETCPLCGAVQ